MTEKSSSTNKQKVLTQPYDSKIAEACPSCQSRVVYRKNSYFGNKAYYKVCNNCGWYLLISRDQWREAIMAATAPKAEKTESEEEPEEIEE